MNNDPGPPTSCTAPTYIEHTKINNDPCTRSGHYGIVCPSVMQCSPMEKERDCPPSTATATGRRTSYGMVQYNTVSNEKCIRGLDMYCIVANQPLTRRRQRQATRSVASGARMTVNLRLEKRELMGHFVTRFASTANLATFPGLTFY